MSKRRILHFIAFYAAAFIVQAVGGLFTQLSVTTWYQTLNKSELTPPGMWFGIAWTTLYFLMSLAAERVYHRTGTLHCHAIRWWCIQLLLGLAWCIVFFGQREILHGLQVIVVSWVATALTLYLFKRVDKIAALLMVPLLLWLSFATYLNFFIWQNN